MWENEHKKTVIRNILIFIVLAIVVAGLGYFYIQVQRQINAEDAKLIEANRNQRQELNDARQENLEAIRQAYELDMNTVAQYMPGIICWGDSLTAGSSGNVSYPYTLQKYLNTYLCDIYDFRYSIENPEGYSRLKWSDYKFSIPVLNMGAGQEDSATILGRAGVAPYVVRNDFVIPAEQKEVTISFTGPNGKKVMPLIAGSAGLNPVTIEGVEGTLSLVATHAGWLQYEYHFTRSEAGEEVPVKAGTEIISGSAGKYTNYVHVVWMGTYDGFRSPDELVSDVKKLLGRQSQNADRYLVIGPCTYGGSWNLDGTFTLDTIDSAMLQAFGNRYINLRKYLIEDGLRDAGITPTKDDNIALQRGFVPNSFRSNAAGADLTGVAYDLAGKLVYERMDRLGYFDEIREELNLNKITQNILKNDPTYFEKQLKTN